MRARVEGPLSSLPYHPLNKEFLIDISRIPLTACASLCGHAVLRLRRFRASRRTCSAQDDRWRVSVPSAVHKVFPVFLRQRAGIFTCLPCRFLVETVRSRVGTAEAVVPTWAGRGGSPNMDGVAAPHGGGKAHIMAAALLSAIEFKRRISSSIKEISCRHVSLLYVRW